MPAQADLERQERLRPRAVALRDAGASVGAIAATLGVPYHVAWRWTSENRGTQARRGRPQLAPPAPIAPVYASRKQRSLTLIWEMEHEGRSHREIGEALDIPRSTVGRWLAELNRDY